jgi:hypothetical protein
MLFGLITFLTAITISGVAIYYSVAGLVAIFAAAAVPIIIMGTALEVGKLVTAVWLHKNWKRAAWWLKTYLSIAVVVLMLITSMGIFGFLSKAHVDQNLSSDTVVQRIEIIDNKVKAEEGYIIRQKDVLVRLTGQSTGTNDRFNQDIAIEQKKIDDAYKRLEVLDADVEAFTSRNKGFGGTGRVKQGLKLREEQRPERDRINAQITQAQENINKLRAQINNQLNANTVEIKTIEKNIFDAQGRIETLILEQEPLKSQLMKLESEVGPIRYIAEFVYGEEADRNLLEEAVRWVIITIIFVFDPLAVLLLIASQYTFRWRYIDKHGEEPTAPKTPPAPTIPPAPVKPVEPQPTGGQSLSKIVEQQKDVQAKSKPIKLSDIAEKKPVTTKPSEEKTTHEMLMEGFEKEQKEREAEEQLEEFKKREEQEAEDLRRVAYDAKEEEWQKVKTVWKEANPHDTIHRHKDLYIKGMIDELPWEKITITDEEPPMPLDQWNKMIEEAEKEVSKEVKKPEPDGSYEDEIKYDLEDKDADPKKKTLSYIMRERNQQVKKEHQED